MMMILNLYLNNLVQRVIVFRDPKWRGKVAKIKSNYLLDLIYRQEIPAHHLLSLSRKLPLEKIPCKHSNSLLMRRKRKLSRKDQGLIYQGQVFPERGGRDHLNQMLLLFQLLIFQKNKSQLSLPNRVI